MDKGKFIPYVVAQKSDGVSARTRAAIKRLDEWPTLPEVEETEQNYFEAPRRRDPAKTIQLPNGQWVTPQEFEQLQRMLRNR
jgi:hypothetical protein